MGYGLKLLFLFLWVCSFYTIGLLIFTKGFLLKRLVIQEKSECNTKETVYSWRFNSSKNVIGSQNVSGRGCSLPSTYSKAVLLIIDALRYDFALYDDSLEDSETLPYQNKLTVIHDLLRRSPDNGRLYRFIADPPTTTMQRLKGLTTGSLPTFVDAGSNFASYEITEDNFITKLVEHGRKITFMGDDTWEGLFPGTFNKSFPFPSFNVKDLHTVDNGVIQHLVPELQHGDWDVLIGHLLGVDHCGHKYGPNHKAMADKLTQMDQVIRSVIEALDNNTVLFVLGDHGMTRTGDHGGDSKDELDAALFVYSLSPLLGGKPIQGAVSQVDLVPTISLLLGLPIPFGNLGTVVTDMFTCEHHVSQIMDALELGTVEPTAAQSLALGLAKTEVLQLNALQVQTYLKKYATISGEMPQAKLEALAKDLEVAEMAMNDVRRFLSSQSTPSENKTAQITLLVEKLSLAEKKYLKFLAEIKELCQTLWAKFDMVSIFFGLYILVFSMLINVLFLALPSEVDFDPVLKTVLFCLCIGGGLSIVGLAVNLLGPLSATAIAFGLSATGFLYRVIRLRTKTSQGPLLIKFPFRTLLLDDFVAFGAYILYCVAVFSNSFVVNEDIVVSYLVHSVASVVVYCAFRKLRPSIITKIFARTSTASKKPKKDNRKTDLLSFISSDSFKLFLAVPAFFSCGRLAAVFRACREEQWTCEQSIFLQQLASLGTEDSSSANQRHLIATFSVFIIPVALRQWLSHQGNLNGLSPAVLSTKYGLVLVPLLMSLHWTLQLVPPKMAALLPNLQLWHQIIIPQAVYCICLLTIALLVWSPLFIFLILHDKDKSFSDTLESYRRTGNMDLRVIQFVFKEVKKKFDQSYNGSVTTTESEKQGSAPLVYGLATVYSASLCVLLVALVLPLVMILGDGLPGSILCLFVQVLMLLEIHGCTCDLRRRKDGAEYKGPSWSVVILWVMLGSQYFYFTGHQSTIPAIRFEAAFVGLPGDLDNLVLPGLLIFLNTFASHVIFAAALPLLFFWPMIPSRLLSGKTSSVGARGDVTDKGEFVCNENSQMLRNSIWRTMLMYLAMTALKVFATACSATVHRRHLMVWKIFAPRFVFEGASFLVSIPVLILVYLFVLRVDVVLTDWTHTIETYCQERHIES